MADELPRIHWRTDEEAFRALRWFEPHAVRLIRASLDTGSTELELRALAHGSNADMVKAAISHMAAHPGAGRVRWLDGDRWDWAESVGKGGS